MYPNLSARDPQDARAAGGQNGRRIARVGPDDDAAVAAEDFFAQGFAPNLLARLENVETVAHDGHQAVGELIEHVPHGVDLMVLAPGANRRVLGGGDGETGHRLGVVIAGDRDPFERVGAPEVHQVCRPADARRLDAADAAKAEIVELEIDQAGIAGSAEMLEDEIFHLPRLRGHRRTVPDLNQQGFEVVRQPVARRIGVFDGHQDVMDRHDRAFGHGPDGHRQPAAVDIDDMFPAGAVKQRPIAEVARDHFLGLLDLRHGDNRAREELFQIVLQAEEDDIVPPSATALEIGVDPLRARRILLPMGQLVAIGAKDEVSGVRHATHLQVSAFYADCRIAQVSPVLRGAIIAAKTFPCLRIFSRYVRIMEPREQASRLI